MYENYGCSRRELRKVIFLRISHSITMAVEAVTKKTAKSFILKLKIKFR